MYSRDFQSLFQFIMTVLIIIFVQIFFLAALLKIIFSLIDKAVATYRKLTLSPNRNQKFRQVFMRWGKNEFNSKVFKSRSHGHSGLWHQLLIRVNFDTPTAERLIKHLKQRHPGQTDRWYIEKAIWDLERDKGRY